MWRLPGKTLRGTQGHLAADQTKMHQVTLSETQTGILLKDQIVSDKENEQRRVEEFCTPLYVKGRIVSADALHTQTQMCATITASEGDYLLIAKDNQPTLHQDLRLFFREPPVDCRDWREAATVEKGRGRLEQRELIASSELNDSWRASGPRWDRCLCCVAGSANHGTAPRSTSIASPV